MAASIDDKAFDVLFRDARTQNGFLDQAVPDDLLRRVWEICRMGPTSMNTQPMRVLFLRTPQAKARLAPALSAGNVEKVKQAPVTAIIGTDSRFYENMPTVWHGEGAREMFAGNAAMADATAQRNSTLQGAYLMIVARGLGLDCGPMSGFDQGKVNAEFFPDGRVKSNFLCNLGYGDTSKLFNRNRRLDFDEACQLL